MNIHRPSKLQHWSVLAGQVVGVACVALAAPASAEVATAGTAESDMSQDGEQSAADLSGQHSIFAQGAVTDGELAEITGRERTTNMLANSENTGIVAGNKIGDNGVTGAVNISDNAFSNVDGISMINLNTGNASVINSALNINLQINYETPAP